MNECSARALLGVPRSATPGQIKRAYRKRALELHPDRGGDSAAFQQLVEAQGRLLRSAGRVERRPGWFDAATATSSTVASRTSDRPPARTVSKQTQRPARRFGDVLAEKLADAA